MLFGNRAPPAPAQRTADGEPKRRSILNIMFNPQIGATVRPLGQAADMFVQIIAMIFAMNGLLPKNHPALNYDPYSQKPAAKLSLGQIFSIAWEGLEFTADGLPKVMLFFAVILCFILMALGTVTAFVLVFFGTAHAATVSGCGSGFFTPCNTKDDLAYNWIGYLFNDGSLGDDMTTNAPGIAGSHAWQDAMITVLGFYSDAMLVIAAFILFYHLVSMVVETAHYGEVMGKRASKIWAPIRLVVAIGLMVPFGNGLNSGQHIVIQIAEWGSGLASQIWSEFVSNLVSDAVIQPPNPYVRQYAENIVQMAACQVIYNWFLNGNSNTPNIDESSFQIAPQTTTMSDGSTQIAYQNNPTDPSDLKRGICGVIILHGAPKFGNTGNNPSAVVGSTLGPAVTSAFTNAFNQAYSVAVSNVSSNINYFVGSNSGAASPPTDIVGPVADAFQNTLDGALSSAIQNLQASEAAMQANWTKWGWASAGTYFNDVAGVQSVVTSIYRDAAPIMQAPSIRTITPANGVDSATQSAIPIIDKFNKWTHATYETALLNAQNNGNNPNNTTSNANNCDALDWNEVETEFNKVKETWASLDRQDLSLETLKKIDPINIVFEAVDVLASKNCVWRRMSSGNQNSGGFSLAIQFTSNNPLAEIAQLGHNNISVGMDLANLFIVLQVANAASHITSATLGRLPVIGGVVNAAGGLVQGGIGMASTVVSTLTTIFIITGIFLAFFVPLIPFTKFFFSAVSWVVVILEAVVAMPLFALAHLNPEGDGLPGASAKSAYFFLFDIFLRPSLMVFGLICGYLVFMTAVAFMNTIYLNAVIGAGGAASGHLAFSRMFFSIIYVMLIYTAANNCFNMIHSFPERALSWMGQRGAPHEKLGDASDLGRHVSLIAGYGSQQFLGGLQTAAASASNQVAGGLNSALSSGPATAGVTAGAGLGAAALAARSLGGGSAASGGSGSESGSGSSGGSSGGNSGGGSNPSDRNPGGNASGNNGGSGGNTGGNGGAHGH